MTESCDFCYINLASNGLNSDKLNELRELVAELIDKNFKNIILNMEKISKVNKNDLETLLSIQKLAMFNNVSIKICKLQKSVTKMLLQARLDKIIEIYEPSENESVKTA
ncbi:MAG: STAS domain-containing protein [Candidatus Gastranaerophilales bacterium]|nr:STAS domain-containing protein [Candidatus Gastranaerophilales bacterium]